MPTYEYRCNECKTVFEKYVPLSDFEQPQHCDCGGDSKRLFPSSFSFINKTGENRPIDSIVGADAERRWDIVHRRKEKRQKENIKKLKTKIKEKSHAPNN